MILYILLYIIGAITTAVLICYSEYEKGSVKVKDIVFSIIAGTLTSWIGVGVCIIESIAENWNKVIIEKK